MMRYSALLQSRLGSPLSSQREGYGRDLAFPLCKSFLYTLTFSKRSLCLLTVLSVFLTGCDSGSAASSVPMDTQSATQSINLSIKNDAASEQYANLPQPSANDTADNDANTATSANGQSLMSAAKTDAGVGVQRTPMISEPRIESTLQATLIGDYKGMLPCDFCDGINMTLNLLSDGSVVKTSIYENPVTPTAPLIESGVYRQDDNTIIVAYNDKNIEMYRIENNHLIMLDEHKKPNADYTLSRK
ncbi:copper resistance protein NlpE [Psychrobacter sp. 16-MNA-CIBAN-0192]|uniref:copper resistance protein NlpE n=1 Tax=Psychrobacter sp. 16-MNA-CIBAN-0192 TaxID=3140448 RepID=UPI00331FF108